MTKLTEAALDRAVAQAMGLKSVNNCEKWGKEMRDPEDEAFDELTRKQWQWEQTSGWRKKQIAHMDTQAFPNPHRTDQTGITRREYFAAKAMQGLLSDPDWRQDMDFEDTAHAAYKQADAMLKAGETK